VGWFTGLLPGERLESRIRQSVGLADLPDMDGCV